MPTKIGIRERRCSVFDRTTTLTDPEAIGLGWVDRSSRPANGLVQHEHEIDWRQDVHIGPAHISLHETSDRPFYLTERQTSIRGTAEPKSAGGVT